MKTHKKIAAVDLKFSMLKECSQPHFKKNESVNISGNIGTRKCTTPPPRKQHITSEVLELVNKRYLFALWHLEEEEESRLAVVRL